jgi:hypothetical protein
LIADDLRDRYTVSPDLAAANFATGSLTGEVLGEPSAELRDSLADSPVRIFKQYLSK